MKMKIHLSEKVRSYSFVAVGLFLLILFMFIVIGWFFDHNYISVTAEINKYEVQSSLLKDATDYVGVCNPEDAAKVWAEGLKKRSAAMQYSVMNEKLKGKYASQLDETAPNWVTGMSSPWIESYRITKNEKVSENCRIIELNFSTATSTGLAGDDKAVLTVATENNFWRISKINMEEGLYPYTGFQSPSEKP